MAKLKHFDILNIKHYVIFITFIVLASCKNAPEHLTELTGKSIPIDSSFTTVDSIQKIVT